MSEFIGSILNDTDPLPLDDFQVLSSNSGESSLTLRPGRTIRILLCLSGRAKASSEGFMAELRESDCLCLPAWTECSLSVREGAFMSVELSGESSLISVPGRGILFGPVPSGMVSCCRDLYREWYGGLRLSSVSGEMLFRLSFGRFLLFLREFLLDAHTGAREGERDIARDIELYIHAHYLGKPNFEEMAFFFGYTSRYLRDVFKKHTGLTMMEYLTEFRLKKACELLRDETRSITDIALDSGYMTVQYFSEVFKKRYGITPSEFRGHASEKCTGSLTNAS